jgi:cytochrome c
MSTMRRRVAGATGPGTGRVGAGAAGPAAVLAVAVAMAVTGACSKSPETLARVVVGASPSAGKAAIVRYGCGSCHTIPGVKGATALVGPPLIHFGRRSFVAGELSNTPDNLTLWIHDPKGVEPKTDMPDLGVSVEDARNIAAYLLRLG